jgi:hypothetical protein
MMYMLIHYIIMLHNVYRIRSGSQKAMVIHYIYDQMLLVHINILALGHLKRLKYMLYAHQVCICMYIHIHIRIYID